MEGHYILLFMTAQAKTPLLINCIKLGVTKGDPVSPTLFIILVYSVVRATLQEICGPQEAQHDFWLSTGEHNICFYADDGQIAGRDPIWVQAELTTMVRKF